MRLGRGSPAQSCVLYYVTYLKEGSLQNQKGEILIARKNSAFARVMLVLVKYLS